MSAHSKDAQKQFIKQLRKQAEQSKNNLVKGDLVKAAEFFSVSGLAPETINKLFTNECRIIFKDWHAVSLKQKLRAINLLTLLISQDDNVRDHVDNINQFLKLLHNNAAFTDVFLQAFSYSLYGHMKECKENNMLINVSTVEQQLLNIIYNGPEHLFANYAVLNVANPDLRAESDRAAYRQAVTTLHTQLKPQGTIQSWHAADIKRASDNVEQKLANHFPVFLSTVKDIVHSGFWEQLKRVYRNTIKAVSSIISGQTHAKEVKSLATTQYVRQGALNVTRDELVDNKADIKSGVESAKTGLRSAAALLNALDDAKAGLEKIISPPAKSFKASPAA